MRRSKRRRLCRERKAKRETVLDMNSIMNLFQEGKIDKATSELIKLINSPHMEKFKEKFLSRK